MSILEKLFRGKNKHFATGGHTPMHELPVRPYRELVEIGKAHGTSFLAAMEGAINGEEYLKLDNGDDDE